MERKKIVDSIIYEIKNVDVFYSQPDAAEFVGIELINGQIFDIEGAIHKIKLGSKYLETNIFLIDSRNFIYPRQESNETSISFNEEQLFKAIIEYNNKPNNEIKIFTQCEFIEMMKQEKNKLDSLPMITKEISNAEIVKLEIINDDYMEIMIITLSSGNTFAVDGKLVTDYVDGELKYTNLFVIKDGIYPCDEYGFAIIDRTVLRSQYVNEGFLCEVSQDNGIINYELTSKFNKAITEAICAYNENSNAKIKIVTKTEYMSLKENAKYDMLPNKILELFQPGNIITIYSHENSQTIMDLMNDAKKKACCIESPIENVSSTEELI